MQSKFAVCATQLHGLGAAAQPLLKALGFAVEPSDPLRNPADERTKIAFEPEIRGKTARARYGLTKPAQ